MGELVAQRPLDLAGEQVPVLAEVAFEGVAVNHDPVLIAFGCQPVAEVLAVGIPLGTEIGDDDGDALNDPLEFLWQAIDRIGDERLKGIRVGLIHCPTTLPSK